MSARVGQGEEARRRRTHAASLAVRGWSARVAAAYLAAACIAGCGEDSGWSAETEHTLGAGTVATQASSGALPPFFDRIVSAPFTTAFLGTRRVVLQRNGEVYDYTEVVGADGTGRLAFDVPHVQSVPASFDPALAAAFLSQRARFGYRVRDPHVTDLTLFAANWRVVVTTRDTSVAGHVCWSLAVERAVPLGPTDVRYELDVEPRSGLVLAWREFDTAGQLHASVAYQTLEFGADVSALDLRERDFVAVDLDPAGDLSVQVGATVRTPSLPPPGFVLEEVELVTLSPAEEWVKFVYTDGFERSFFVHRIDRAPSLPAPTTSRVMHAPFGPWTFALGEVERVEVLAAGKVPPRFLGELIQSAIR